MHCEYRAFGERSLEEPAARRSVAVRRREGPFKVLLIRPTVTGHRCTRMPAVLGLGYLPRPG